MTQSVAVNGGDLIWLGGGEVNSLGSCNYRWLCAEWWPYSQVIRAYLRYCSVAVQSTDPGALSVMQYRHWSGPLLEVHRNWQFANGQWSLHGSSQNLPMVEAMGILRRSSSPSPTCWDWPLGRTFNSTVRVTRATSIAATPTIMPAFFRADDFFQNDGSGCGAAVGKINRGTRVCVWVAGVYLWRSVDSISENCN